MKNKKEVVDKAMRVLPQSIRVITINIAGPRMLSNKILLPDAMDLYRKQLGETVEKRPRVGKEEEIDGHIHRNSEGKASYPVSAFITAMADCTPYIPDKKICKKLVLGAVMWEGDEETVELKYEKAEGRMDVAYPQKGGAPKVIFRPLFINWKVKLRFNYDESQISANQVAKLVELAGRYIGVGPWRPQSRGTFGKFNIVNT